MTMIDEDKWITQSICQCCLIITANGDHSGCEGNCGNTDCDEKCDHGCAATFGYTRPENRQYRLTASYADCTPDHDGDECVCGEGYFSWSPCDWCGNIAGTRVDVYAYTIPTEQGS